MFKSIRIAVICTPRAVHAQHAQRKHTSRLITAETPVLSRCFSQCSPKFALRINTRKDEQEEQEDDEGKGKPEHAVISTFDLFSIGGV